MLSFFIFTLWLIGSHGHPMLRKNMMEDWIFAGALLLSLLFSVLFMVSWILRRKKNKMQ